MSDKTFDQQCDKCQEHFQALIIVKDSPRYHDGKYCHTCYSNMRGKEQDEIDRLKAELAAARELLRGCWIQCDTFKKPVMCWDMYHALEKWATGKSSVPEPGATMADFDLEETSDSLDAAAGRGEGAR